jgi:hypothetical protein
MDRTDKGVVTGMATISITIPDELLDQVKKVLDPPPRR